MQVNVWAERGFAQHGIGLSADFLTASPPHGYDDSDVHRDATINVLPPNL